MPDWICPRPNGVILRVAVVPRASKNEIIGPVGEPPRLKIRIKAPPVEGEANEELVRFLSKELSVPRSAIIIQSGAHGKKKDVFLAGLNAEGEELLCLTKFSK